MWTNTIERFAPLIVVALLALCSCATPEKHAQLQPKLIWPSPPDAPRIAYVQSISRPADLGLKISAGARALQWIFGSNKDAEFLIKPFGVALDENDNLCISDTGANAVCFHDRSKKTWQRWNKVGNLHFASPVAVAKRNETIYVADSGLAAVVAFSVTGKLQFSATNHLTRPAGLVIHGERLFVVDSVRQAVVLFDLNGKFVSEFGKRGTGNGEFNFPTHIASDGERHIFVTDSMNSRIQVFDADGNFKSVIGSAGDAPGHFGRPKGLAVDLFGHVYVIDGIFDMVQIFDRGGQLLLNFGGSGSLPGEFWLANGIAISRSNDIYIADAYNRRVQVFKYIGGEQ